MDFPKTCETVASPKTLEANKEIISSLPTEKGWRSTFQNLCLYQNFWCYPSFLEGVLFIQQNFQVQPTDIFVCSVPKSGSTWLKALTFSIVTISRYGINSTTPLLSKLPHHCFPMLELSFFSNPIRGSDLPLFATHIPYPHLPESITQSPCKIVYICRDPKDAFVSLWHFERKQQPENQEPTTLEETFELFCRGASNYGPYWDHVLGFWKASLQFPEKVLFLKYGDMLSDTVFYVKRLAEFVVYPFSMEEERDGIVQKIIDFCSFENLSNLEVNKTGKNILLNTGTTVENNIFFRRGKVGDWKNHLPVEMAARLDKITEEKLSGSNLILSVSK